MNSHKQATEIHDTGYSTIGIIANFGVFSNCSTQIKARPLNRVTFIWFYGVFSSVSHILIGNSEIKRCVHRSTRNSVLLSFGVKLIIIHLFRTI